MTKLIFTSLLTTILLISCVQNQHNQQSDNSTNIVMDTTGNAIAEKNLKSQLREYLVAFNTGDVDKALYFTYPDIFEYIKQQYPDVKVNMQEIKDSLFIEPLKMMKKLVKEKKIKYEFEVGNITKKVSYKDSKLYMVITYVNSKIGLDKNSMGGEVIGISNDNGVNWKFVQNDPKMIQGVLSLKFPRNIIDSLLAKE